MRIKAHRPVKYHSQICRRFFQGQAVRQQHPHLQQQLQQQPGAGMRLPTEHALRAAMPGSISLPLFTQIEIKVFVIVTTLKTPKAQFNMYTKTLTRAVKVAFFLFGTI